MILCILCAFVYIISVAAVALWDKATRGTPVMSWVDNSQIFMPIYNTVIAIQLWRNFNPFN